jgi:Putative Ig domain
MKLLSFSFAWLLASAVCLICVLSNGIAASQGPAAAISADHIALPEGKQNVEYEFRFESEGGAAPISWKLVDGELPPGLTLDASGRLHGLPSTARREVYKFVVEAADSAATPQRATQPFLLLIQAAPLRIKNPNGLRIQSPQAPGASTPTPSSVPGVSMPGAVAIAGSLSPPASNNTPPATSGPGASIPPTGPPARQSGSTEERDDMRENFEASGYIGIGVDSFAAGEIKKVLNRGDSSGQKERFVGGFDFAYRLFGDPAKDAEGGWWKNKNQQLWFFGGTTHGVRSADVDCRANSDVCKDVFDVTATPQRFLYVLRNASSLEGFVGVRWESAQMNRLPALSSARAYLKAQAGFLTVTNGIDDVYDIHHVAAGLIATNSRFKDSYLEFGFGRTDLFTENRRRRFKIDGLLSWKVPQVTWFRPFAQIKIDTDLGRGSDSVQSYFGFDFDLSCLFRFGETACR